MAVDDKGRTRYFPDHAPIAFFGRTRDVSAIEAWSRHSDWLSGSLPFER
jgi:hypothetical protein